MRKRKKINYKFLKKYDFIHINNCEKLIKPPGNEDKNVLYYVTNEELFVISHGAHISIFWHGGRDRMLYDSMNSLLTKIHFLIYWKIIKKKV